MTALRNISTRIAGFNHRPGAADVLERLPANARLTLLPEPENEHDRFAVQVISPAGKVLGYVPRDVSEKVAGYLRDRDAHVRCYKDARTFNSITITATTGDPAG